MDHWIHIMRKRIRLRSLGLTYREKMDPAPDPWIHIVRKRLQILSFQILSFPIVRKRIRLRILGFIS